MRARSAPLMLLLAMTFGQAAAYMTSPPAVTSRGCQVSTNRAAFMAGFGKKVEKKEKTFDGKKTFEKHMMQYDELRVDGYPPPNVVDVYVHAKGAEKFWFVGKCCAREGAGLEDGPALAAVRQKRLVFEHAKLLQPRELGGLKGMKPKDLELWCAPPNSEISVAQRMQGLRSLNDMKPVDELTMEDVGFLPEQYTAEDGKGFHVRLPPDGQPSEKSSVKIISPEEAAAGGLDMGGLDLGSLGAPQ